ncbi:MAG TPA: MFS transporter [Gaiella sp.]
MPVDVHPSGAATLFRPQFALVCVYSLATTLAAGTLLPVLPLYVRGPLDGGDVAVGIVMSGALLVGALAQPVLGRIADRRGRRLLLLGGPLVFSSFVVFFPVASDPAALFALRAAAGVGDAACIVGSVTMINDLAPEGRRGEAYSLYSLSAWAGLGLGPVIGDFVHRATSFGAVWMVAIALSLTGAVLALALPETRPQTTRPRPGFALFTRSAAIPGIVIALEMFGFAALVVFSPLYARELGMQGAGLVLLVNAAVLVAMRVLGRRLPDRVGPRRAASVGVLLAAGGIGLAAVLGSPAGLYLGAAIFGAGHALLYPALFLLAVGRAREDERSAALGSLKALEGLGFAFAAAFIGLVASLGGYGVAFGVGAAITAAGLIPLRAFLPRSRLERPAVEVR